jgi:hypothetical protein
MPVSLLPSLVAAQLTNLAPTHVAVGKDTGVVPSFTQQSMRENVRTGRNPQIDLDDTIWTSS